MGKYEKNKIYVMDCIERMKQLLDNGEADIIVTSPLYNLGIKYNHYDDTISREDYLDLMETNK